MLDESWLSGRSAHIIGLPAFMSESTSIRGFELFTAP